MSLIHITSLTVMRTRVSLQVVVLMLLSATVLLNAQTAPEDWRTLRDENGYPKYRRLMEAIDGSPRFSRLLAPGDERWSEEFAGADQSNFNADIHAVAATPSNATDGDIFSGGAFTRIGRDTINYVAKWDGSQWVPLGSGANNGTNGLVLALTISGNNLYVGGQFTRAGGVAVNNIAVYNILTGQWSALGNGVSANQFGYVTTIAVAGNNVYVGGNFATAGSGTSVNNIAVWNTTSRNWSALGSGANNGTSGEISAMVFDNTGALYVAGSFRSAGGNTVNNVAKWSSSSWSALGTGVNGYVNALGYDTQRNWMYAGGSFNKASGKNANNIAKWVVASSRWDSLGVNYWEPTIQVNVQGVNGVVRAINCIQEKVYVAGTFTEAAPGDYASVPVGTSFIARYWSEANQTTTRSNAWASLGLGVDGYVNALASRDTTLIVVGAFRNAGQETAIRAARWRNKWISFNASAEGSVFSVALVEGQLYAAGQFKDPKTGVPTYLAKWQQRWIPITGGTDGKIYSIIALDSFLIVGGRFTSAGGSSALNIVRYNTHTNKWTALTPASGVGGGAGGISYVNAMRKNGDIIYVAGQFTIADSVRANNIASWNARTGQWGTLGSGADATVLSVTTAPNGDVYIGGRFFNVGGIPAYRVARYNGSSWSALDSVNGDVTSIAASGSNVFIGGLFTRCGTDSIPYIAKWDGQINKWTSMNGGVDRNFSPLVNAIAVTGNDVFVGGNFSTAGGVLADNIAVWNDAAKTWAPLGSGVGNIARTITITTDSVYVGGDFTQAGGKPSYYVGLWRKPPVIKGDNDPPGAVAGFESGPTRFNGPATIRYLVPSIARVRLSIANMLGQEITVLRDELSDAGEYSARWNPGHLADGMYFLRLQYGTTVLTKKVMVTMSR